jgi:Protein of unknown function (DUF1592)/Protein of unknown function (DUF1588)/Protein of unknown function (DUF1585)/Protein of unknown function (DUF1587)/Protein of unknown function (DUF1595)/Planctomycete cytochrome C
MKAISPRSKIQSGFFYPSVLLAVCVAVSGSRAGAAQTFPADDVAAFTDRHCSSCHNDVDKESGLDLTNLKYNPADADNFTTWVKIHDRVSSGEMPPKEKKRPEGAELAAFTQSVSASLIAFEGETTSRLGRSVRRRLNRNEYESSLRDLLSAPWLLVKDQLPEDGEAAHFNKVSRALDVSHVHMQRYMRAADYAMRQVMAVKYSQPPTKTTRYYARNNFNFSNQDGNPDRGRFPVLDSGPDLPALSRIAPLTVGDADPERRDREAMAVTASHFWTGFQSNWNQFQAPVTGRYNLKLSGYTIWVGPNGSRRPSNSFLGNIMKAPPNTVVVVPPEWHRPNHADVTVGRRYEPVHVYAQFARSGSSSRIGQIDLTPEPNVYEMNNVMLTAGQGIIVDAVRFFRSRPGFTAIDHYTNKLAQRDGMPGVAYRWMEVEGPLYDESTTAGYKLLFGDLPLVKTEGDKPGVEVEVMRVAQPVPPGGAPGRGRGPQPAGGRGGAGGIVPVAVEVESVNPDQDAERLIGGFLARAYRRPSTERELQRFVGLFKDRYKAGLGFAGAMLASYTAVLASQEYVYLDEKPGKLDDYALATRLALFLWNSEPDLALRARAGKGELTRPDVLRAETERMLADSKASRFVDAFLDYWLEVRRLYDTTPDIAIHNDYYLDDVLLESSVEESRLFFTELLNKNLPARNIVDSDFTFVNDRLASHYSIDGVVGGKMRRIALPADSVRGGVMTQAIVLKVTANGTTTSPVLRGKWIMERVVGFEIPPPPAAVPAVEPDIRGAVTIRQQLDKHRADESCAGCHKKIDAPGFALESFDVMGAWRDRYRALNSAGQTPERGFGQNGWPLAFYYGLPVDPSGATADGRPYKDVREFKALLLQDEPQIARNFAKQLSVFATGAPVRFSDRAKIEQILQKTTSSDHGIRSILHEVIQSELFLNK